MALPISSLNAFLTIPPRLPPSQIGISLKANFCSYSILPRNISRLSISFASRRNHTDSSTTPLLKEEEEPVVLEKDKAEKEDLLKEAFEAFFGDDLENDDSLIEDVDDEISDEELIKLERELEEAFKDYEEEHIIDSTVDEGDDDDEEEEEELLSKLENWQLHRLAYALKDDSRRTNVKDLADDLCLDQKVVLKLLSDPILLLMTAALPDNLDSTIDPSEPASTVSDIESYTPERYASYEMAQNSDEDEDLIIEEDEDEDVIIDFAQTD